MLGCSAAVCQSQWLTYAQGFNVLLCHYPCSVHIKLQKCPGISQECEAFQRSSHFG